MMEYLNLLYLGDMIIIKILLGRVHQKVLMVNMFIMMMVNMVILDIQNLILKDMKIMNMYKHDVDHQFNVILVV